MSELITRWLTVKEAAIYTRTDEAWILEHIKNGALKYVPTARRTKDSPKGPRRRIIDRIKVDALMESLETYEVVRAPGVDAEPESAAKPILPPVRTRGMSARERLERGL